MKRQGLAMENAGGVSDFVTNDKKVLKGRRAAGSLEEMTRKLNVLVKVSGYNIIFFWLRLIHPQTRRKSYVIAIQQRGVERRLWMGSNTSGALDVLQMIYHTMLGVTPLIELRRENARMAEEIKSLRGCLEQSQDNFNKLVATASHQRHEIEKYRTTARMVHTKAVEFANSANQLGNVIKVLLDLSNSR